MALQAALMGYDYTTLSAKQLNEVCQRLVDDHGVELPDVKPSEPTQFTEAIEPQDCEFDLSQWTVQHLDALGFATKIVTEQQGDELVVKRATADDGKNDEPLYRCSFDREYWRGRGESHTLREWGSMLEKTLTYSLWPLLSRLLWVLRMVRARCR